MDISKHTSRSGCASTQPADYILRQMTHAARDEGRAPEAVIVSKDMGDELGVNRYGEIEGVIIRVSENHDSALPVLIPMTMDDE